MTDDLAARGEDRHQRCRWGMLTESWSVSVDEMQRAAARDSSPRWKPGVIPLCTFPLSEPVPPMLHRIWSGGIDLRRDCAVCPAYRPLDEDPGHDR